MAGVEPVSRPRKLGHLDTILYEVDMLNYCYGRLRGGKFADQRDYYLCIEGFLLHYRNLIQFFGNHHDLKAGEPHEWSPRELTDAELASIQDAGPFNRHSGQISQYLSHCTKSRAERDRDWKHVAMYEELKPMLENFDRLFPRQKEPPRELTTLGRESVSTATISYYQSLINLPEGPPRRRDKGDG